MAMRDLKNMFVFCVLSVLCFQPGKVSAGGDFCSYDAAQDVDVPAIVSLLAQTTVQQIADGHNNWYGPLDAFWSSSPFGICVDPHTAYECHWQVFRADKVTGGGFSTEAQASYSDIDVNALDDVAGYFDYLTQTYGYVIPNEAPDRSEFIYGRGTFLALAIEYAKWGSANNQSDYYVMLPYAQKVAEDLLDYFYNTTVNPLDEEYYNHSIALYHLYRFFSMVADFDGIIQFTEDYPSIGGPYTNWNYFRMHNTGVLIKQNILDQVYPLSFTESSGEGFMSRFSSMVALSSYVFPNGTQDFEQWVDDYIATINDPSAPLGDTALPTPRSVGDNFRAKGRLWTRVWAFKKLISRLGTSDPNYSYYEHAYLEHICEGMTHHDQFAIQEWDWVYTHWVPVFGTWSLTQ